MKIRSLLIICMVLMIALTACSRNKKAEGDLVAYPGWWNTQPEKDYVCTYGMGTKVSQTASIDAARANALAEAAQYVETNVQSMLKNYEEEAGVFDPQVLALTQKVVKAVSDAEFRGVINGDMETRKVSEYGGARFTTYMQLKVPKSEIDKNLYNNIHNEEALYNQFKASQAFKELEEAVKNK